MHYELPGIRDKVVLVTGASRGIGKATMLQFAKMGAKVIGTATSAEGAQRITQFCEQQGVVGQGLVLELTGPEHIVLSLVEAASFYGDIQIAINNAGLVRDNLMLRMKTEEWNTVITANLTGLFHITKMLLKPMMKARFGRIVNVSSFVGSAGNPGQANYCASKAGIEGFTRALALEMGSRNITANAVAPGFIETDMTEKLPEDFKTATMARLPLQRLGTVDDIANMCTFLASDLASYITGQVMHVNGGLYISP